MHNSVDRVPVVTGPSRSDRVRATRARKLDAVFAGKTFDILREVHLPDGQQFQTQFGHRGRHGYVIRDRASGEKHLVGWTVLKHIHDRYCGVTLPKQKTRRAPTPPD